MALQKRSVKRWMPKNQYGWIDDPPDTGSTSLNWIGVGVGSQGGAMQGHEDGGTGSPSLSQAWDPSVISNAFSMDAPGIWHVKDLRSQETIAQAVILPTSTAKVLHVRLSNRNLGDEGLASLARYIDDTLQGFISSNLSIEDVWCNLDLDHNNFSDSGLEAIMEVMERHSLSIRRACLNQNWISDKGATRLATLVSRQTHPLQELHLSHNQVTARALVALCLAIDGHAWSSDFPAPCWLRLEHNRIAEPLRVLDLLRHYGVHTCLAKSRAKCGPGCCAFIFPRARAHLYLLSSQRTKDAEFVEHTELCEMIRQWYKHDRENWKEQALCLFELVCKPAKSMHSEIPSQQIDSEVPSFGEAAGRELLMMLKGRETPPPPLSATRSEPQPLSMDEYQLWMMEAREDAEGGADALNAETFGNDHDLGWSFEENLAANDMLTQRSESEASSNRHVANLRSKALGFALKEMRHFIEFKPKGLQKAVRAIIEQGWSNITWQGRFTPFHLATELNQPEILRLLFLIGGDPIIEDVEGQTPMDIAKSCQHWECMDVLMKLCSQSFFSHVPQDHPHANDQACQLPVPSFVAPTLAAQIRQTDANDTSRDVERLKLALIEACKYIRIEPSSLKQAILHLLTTGSSFLPGSQSELTTVLHLAAEHGRHDLIPMIVALGSNPSLRDWSGRTPMQVAWLAGHQKCVEALDRCQLLQEAQKREI